MFRLLFIIAGNVIWEFSNTFSATLSDYYYPPLEMIFNRTWLSYFLFFPVVMQNVLKERQTDRKIESLKPKLDTGRQL